MESQTKTKALLLMNLNFVSSVVSTHAFMNLFENGFTSKKYKKYSGFIYDWITLLNTN